MNIEAAKEVIVRGLSGYNPDLIHLYAAADFLDLPPDHPFRTKISECYGLKQELRRKAESVAWELNYLVRESK